MKEILTTFDLDVLLESKELIFLDFYSDHCGSCQDILPEIDKTKSQFEGQVEFRKINVDRLSVIANNFSVRTIPSLYLIKDGKIVQNEVGFKTNEDLSEMIHAQIQVA